MINEAHIRFSPEILRRLGEELNPYPDKGILELAKNSYDADAINCTIVLRRTDKPGGVIEVLDDGNGMDVEDIRAGWLILGHSSKSAKKKTKLGRTPAGSKGLGRLAALRLGSRVLMTTRPSAEPKEEHNLLIDWDDFDGVNVVDEVALKIETSTRATGQRRGTTIRLENLSSNISRMDVRRLARELILLADPFGDDPHGFKPVLVAPEFDDIERLVRKRYFDDAEYHLVAKVDKNGFGAASVKDWRGNTLFTAKHPDLDRSDKEYRCPPAELNLWVFLLDAETFSTRKTKKTEVQAWLETFGGVHLYQNGIRVTPYGDPGNDWLDLNLRRARSPEERPSTNTVIGRVVVFDNEELLTQKTDRSGFIETESFHELRRFAVDATDWLARKRMEIAQARRAKERAAALNTERPSRAALFAEIDKAPPTQRKKLRKAAEEHDREEQSGKEKLRKQIQLYRTLSTAGITAATFAHESAGSPIKAITLSISAIERRAKAALSGEYEKLLEKPVQAIMRAIQGLAVLSAATSKLLDHEKRRRGEVKLHNVIEEILDTFKPFTDGRDVSVIREFAGGSPFLHASPAAIESIVTNLVNNSVTALESATVRNRVIRVRTEISGKNFTLRVADNGPGIKGISKSDIWLPGETTRKNGTGLGLAIVKDTTVDLGGDVDVIEQSDLGGAEIGVEFPILGF